MRDIWFLVHIINFRFASPATPGKWVPFCVKICCLAADHSWHWDLLSLGIKGYFHLLHSKQEPCIIGLVHRDSRDIINGYLDKKSIKYFLNNISYTSCGRMNMGMYWERIFQYNKQSTFEWAADTNSLYMLSAAALLTKFMLLSIK